MFRKIYIVLFIIQIAFVFSCTQLEPTTQRVKLDKQEAVFNTPIYMLPGKYHVISWTDNNIPHTDWKSFLMLPTVAEIDLTFTNELYEQIPADELDQFPQEELEEYSIVTYKENILGTTRLGQISLLADGQFQVETVQQVQLNGNICTVRFNHDLVFRYEYQIFAKGTVTLNFSDACSNESPIIFNEYIFHENQGYVGVHQFITRSSVTENQFPSILYTSDLKEKNHLVLNHSDQFQYAGISFVGMMYDSPAFYNNALVHRFYSIQTDSYFYSLDYNEIEEWIKEKSDKWEHQGPVAYGMFLNEWDEDLVSVYRFWNATFEKYYFTTDEQEKDLLCNDEQYQNLWEFEGTAFYMYK